MTLVTMLHNTPLKKLHACKMELCIKNVPHHAFLQYFTHLAG